MRDLKERTFEFTVRVMKFAESLPTTRSGNTVANQVIRSGSSVGANYRAAKRAKSNKDFIHKMGTVEEECDETVFWLEVAEALGLAKENGVQDLRHEAEELLAISVASIKTAKNRTQT